MLVLPCIPTMLRFRRLTILYSPYCLFIGPGRTSTPKLGRSQGSLLRNKCKLSIRHSGATWCDLSYGRLRNLQGEPSGNPDKRSKTPTVRRNISDNCGPFSTSRSSPNTRAQRSLMSQWLSRSYRRLRLLLSRPCCVYASIGHCIALQKPQSRETRPPDLANDSDKLPDKSC